MKAEIITIGDEILVGQTVDTNSARIAQQLKLIGVKVQQIVSIADNADIIIQALENALVHADLVLITGGLGPTNDDITKKVLTDYFDDELVFHEEISNEIESHFKSVNRAFLEVNKQQAMLPKNATIIRNELGTASGMWFQKDGKDIISMPGVPYEMAGLIEKILPDLKEKYQLSNFYHQTILLQGVAESILADEIADLENEIRENGITMSYLPSTGLVKIRLTATLDKKEKIAKYVESIAKKFPAAVFGYESDTLESVVGNLLQQKEKTVGTVESCSGGAIAQRIVSTAGSSGYYKGSIVSYAYELKKSLVNVSNEDLWEFGAVSQEVVEQMAKGGLEKLNVDYCIATSGIAGPGGGTTEKPVGTVWIAVASKEKVYSKKFNFKQNRDRNIESTVVYGLNFLRRVLLNMED
jgi:competence/damage-inducible protein CinA-like protein